MSRREMGSKRGSLPPKEGDLTCMKLTPNCPLSHGKGKYGVFTLSHYPTNVRQVTDLVRDFLP